MKDGQPRKRKPFIVYYRVSTNKQGVTGLGMSAQQTAVKDYLKDKYPPKYEFKEVESGKKAHRPELTKALKLTKNQNGILLVAKLDRLSRDLHFITSLEKAKINFVCCDYPSMDRFQLHIMGSIAQWEREQISRRTKAALAEAKKKGQLLGSRHPTVQAALEKWRAQRAILRRQTEQQKKTALRRKITKQRLSKRERWDRRIHPILKALRHKGLSFAAIARELNALGIKSRRKRRWHATQIGLVLKRRGLIRPAQDNR